MRQLIIKKQLTQRTEESINRYFQEINRYDLISAEEEVDLSVRIRNGDTKALEKLVLANLRFVVSVAKQYLHNGLSFPDLINEGNLGLVKAASRFDEKRGFKFISYAVWWIRQSILQAIFNTRMVRLPINRLAIISKIKKAVPNLEQKFGREPTEDEIADYLGMSNDEIELSNTIKMHHISFDKPLLNSEGNDSNLYDYVQTGNIPPTDANVMKESLVSDVQRALNKLSRREAAIITMTFGLENTPVYTVNHIAQKYQMSLERVRQIRMSGLEKLKILLKGNHAYMEYQ